MNYWCDAQSKAEYSDLLKQNENNYQEELREKYNPDNIFKKNNQVQHIMQDTISNEVINDNVAMAKTFMIVRCLVI